MRICRVQVGGIPVAAFYDESGVLPLPEIAKASGLELEADDDILRYLPHGDLHSQAQQLAAWIKEHPAAASERASAPADAELLVPIPCPPKLFLLAGNYAQHIEEGGEKAAERAETFPYVFMKPSSTTLTIGSAIEADCAISTW